MGCPISEKRVDLIGAHVLASFVLLSCPLDGRLENGATTDRLELLVGIQ